MIRLRVNNLKGTVAVMAATDQTVTLGAALPASAVPVSGASITVISVESDTANEEVIYIQGPASTGTTYPCARGQEGSTAIAHVTGSPYVHGPTQGDFPGFGRGSSTYTSASIAANASATGTISMAKSYRILTLQTTVPARVRVYTTAAKRDADLSRAVGATAPSNSGLMLEYITTDTTLQELSPLVDGFNNEATLSTNIAISVTNNSSAAAAVGVTLGYLGTE